MQGRENACERRRGSRLPVRRLRAGPEDDGTSEIRPQIKLAPQPARVLALLASRPGELVGRDEIRRELWRDGTLSFLGHVYARVGRREEAVRFVQELDQLSSQGKASPIAFVVLYAGLGDFDAAFEWLETACRLRDDLAWLFSPFPGIDPLRPDPRFMDLVHRMGIARP